VSNHIKVKLVQFRLQNNKERTREDRQSHSEVLKFWKR